MAWEWVRLLPTAEREAIAETVADRNAGTSGILSRTDNAINDWLVVESSPPIGDRLTCSTRRTPALMAIYRLLGEIGDVSNPAPLIDAMEGLSFEGAKINGNRPTRTCCVAGHSPSSVFEL
ncbi:MAG: hypothetical protein H6649_08090 [Caldilineae bacterium]|nr:hypothetical protein [Caldilineae bacterium]